jgi:hypothetical protein
MMTKGKKTHLAQLLGPGKKKRTRFLRYSIPALFLVGCVLLGVLIFHPEPPMQKIENCQQMVERARKANAELYAREWYLAAVEDWDRMVQQWRQENNRWFFNRDYDQIASLCDSILKLAVLAEAQALQSADSLRLAVEGEISFVSYRIQQIRDYSGSLPSKHKIASQLSQSEILFLESKEAFKRGDIQQTIRKIRQAQTLLNGVEESLNSMTLGYFRQLPLWKAWAKETVEWSRVNKQAAVIIDKFAHTCLVYDHGQLIHEFPAELGKNWLGAKQQYGDSATPEGKYAIRQKKAGAQTRYYKALVLNYPNETDKKNFQSAVKTGRLSSEARIGGFIEIHGEGAKGVDWTQGCIALKNEDMDRLFDMTRVGTPVTIVGSLLDNPPQVVEE